MQFRVRRHSSTLQRAFRPSSRAPVILNGPVSRSLILARLYPVPLTLILAIFVVLFGLAFGSFLNVCIARLPRHRSIVSPGSACPNCCAQIRVSDNVPVLSWILLRARCRTCRWHIPWRYPATEIATAALFLLCYLRFGLTVTGAGMAVLSFLLLGLAVMDAETMRLPDAFTLPGIALGIVWHGTVHTAAFAIHLQNAAFSLLWAVCAALLIWLIRWFYSVLRHREGMGLGDAKLLALIAAWLGPALTALTFVLGTCAAAVFGIALLVKQRRPTGPSRTAAPAQLPFGSFLCAAALYALFAGQPLVTWYAGFFR